MIYIENQSPFKFTSSKFISSPDDILASIYSDNISSPSLTSVTLDRASFIKTGIKFNSERSSVSPVHVDIAMPFLGWSLKFEAILSIMIDFDKSLLIKEISLILT